MLDSTLLKSLQPYIPKTRRACVEDELRTPPPLYTSEGIFFSRRTADALGSHNTSTISPIDQTDAPRKVRPDRHAILETATNRATSVGSGDSTTRARILQTSNVTRGPCEPVRIDRAKSPSISLAAELAHVKYSVYQDSMPAETRRRFAPSIDVDGDKLSSEVSRSRDVLRASSTSCHSSTAWRRKHPRHQDPITQQRCPGGSWMLVHDVAARSSLARITGL